MNYNKWSMICTVQYMDLTPSVNIDELHQVEYDMHFKYMDLNLPVNIDELQQVEYDIFCTIYGSSSIC